MAEITVHEITMVLPDLVCVEIRDEPVLKGFIEGPLETPDSGDGWQTRTNPVTLASDKCFIVGPDVGGGEREYRRFDDVQPTNYLDRDAADVAADWDVGGLTPTAVYRKTIPYDSGQGFGAVGYTNTAFTSMSHFMFLKLPSDLTEGTHTIEFPAGTGIDNVDFTFEDKTTRAIAIHVNQLGHRPGDVDKLAYFGYWMPGHPNEGAIELDLIDIPEFHLINEAGTIVFTYDIALRVEPDSVEPDIGGAESYGFGGNMPMASTDPTKTLTITDATRTDPVVIEVASTASLTNGDQVYILNMDGDLHGVPNVAATRGMTELNSQRYKIANKTGTTFELTNPADDSDIDGTAFTVAHQGSGGQVRPVVALNQAGTYVYGLDFSAFTTSGTYRIYIPGIGVSDEIQIDDAAWHRAAHLFTKGEYHQRLGIAKDGRYGYTAPVNLKDGEGSNGSFTIFQSSMPGAICTLGGLVPHGLIQPVPCSDGAFSPWVTATQLTGMYGGWADAGDLDCAIANAHALSAYWLLVANEIMDEDSRTATNFNIPKSSEVLDPATYPSPTDALPEQVHSALYLLDFFRRLQHVDGRVPAGFNIAENDHHGDPGQATFEPSYITRKQGFVYEASEIDNYAYAGCAAKMAMTLAEAGFSTLATLWEESAEDAWTWAETLFNSSVARDAYYITELDIKTKASWSDPTYATNMGIMDAKIADYGTRTFAAAALFRLTGTAGYKTVYDAAITDLINPHGYGGASYWEYIHAAGADGTLVTAATNSLTGLADLYATYIDADVSYRLLRYGAFGGLDPNFGKCGTNMDAGGIAVMYGLGLDPEEPSYLKALQAGMAHILGANQTGMCLVTGGGTRHTKGALWRDSIDSGADTPAGMGQYAYQSIGFPFAALNFGTSPLHYVTESHDNAYASDYEAQRTLSHFKYSAPIFETYIQNPLNIGSMEFTTEQNVVPNLAVALVLHGHDGNTFTGDEEEEPEPNTIRFIFRKSA